MARIGFRFGSKASSVIVKPFMRTGSTRFGPHTSMVRGASGATTSITPAAARTSLAITVVELGYSSSSSRDSAG